MLSAFRFWLISHFERVVCSRPLNGIISDLRFLRVLISVLYATWGVCEASTAVDHFTGIFHFSKLSTTVFVIIFIWIVVMKKWILLHYIFIAIHLWHATVQYYWVNNNTAAMIASFNCTIFTLKRMLSSATCITAYLLLFDIIMQRIRRVTYNSQMSRKVRSKLKSGMVLLPSFHLFQRVHTRFRRIRVCFGSLCEPLAS